MTPPAASRGGSRGPRRPAQPRSGNGRRGGGDARRPGRAAAAGTTAHEPLADPGRAGSPEPLATAAPLLGPPPLGTAAALLGPRPLEVDAAPLAVLPPLGMAAALLGPPPLGTAAALLGPPSRETVAAQLGPPSRDAATPLGPPSRTATTPSGPDVDAREEAASRAPARGLSGLQLLLDQLDALLRDPTLTRALKAFSSRLAAGVRGLAASIAQALRALPRIRLRLPRRLLLALLALTLPLALLALLNSSDDDRSTPAAGSQPAAVGPASAGVSLPVVGMPALTRATEKPKAVRVVLVVDRTYDPVALRRELRALGTWLAEHHASGTRVTLIDARSARASAPLRPAELAAASALRARPSTASAVRAALGGPQDRRLLVTLGSTAPALASGSTLSVATRRDASAGVPVRRGRRSRVEIDDRRPNALAASVARAIMAVSGQSERR